MTDFPQYEVFIQPLLDLNEYGVNTEVTTYIRDNGIGIVQQNLDRYDFDIGVFKFNFLVLKCVNQDGFFNKVGDLFTFKRDLAKVQINYLNTDGTTNTQFKGLINELGTVFSKDNDNVTFNILSEDNILSQVQIVTGDISNGDLFSTAIKSILDKSEITKVLNFNNLKINPNLDLTIDDASKLIGLTTKKGLNLLLQASNSIFFIDTDDDMTVGTQTTNGNEITFYGAQDVFGRDNIIEINNYTDGLSKVFNSIFVNGEESKDNTSILNNGLRKKEFTFDFITTSSKNLQIGASYVAEYKDEKKQVNIIVGNEERKNVDFLNPIELDLNQSVYNNIPITISDEFKIVGFVEDPTNYLLTIKLRQI